MKISNILSMIYIGDIYQANPDQERKRFQTLDELMGGETNAEMKRLSESRLRYQTCQTAE